MIPEAARQLATELVQAYNRHDLDRASSFYAADYEGVDVAQPLRHRGLIGVRQTITNYWTAFPDLQFVQDDLIVEPDRVVQVWTARGTHLGALMNIPPSGRRVAVHGVSVLTLDGERIQRALYVWDVAGLLRSIGLLPDL
jgi:steroid delta-isomerase-like uncharacterized protein